MAKPVGKAANIEAVSEPADALDQLDKLARLLSLIAIPIVLAIIGWFIQSTLSDRNVKLEYVKLAISILKEPKDKIEQPLRDWAVNLLDQNSPTKFSSQVSQALKAGQVTLPGVRAPACYLRHSDNSWLVCFLDSSGVYGQCQPYSGTVHQPICG